MIHRLIEAAGAGPLATGPEPALAHALADELVALTSLLADLAYDLASNPDTLRHHMQSLQDIDRITQTQLAIADLLRSPAPADQSLATTTLESLADSLRQSLDRYRTHAAADATSTVPLEDITGQHGRYPTGALE